MKAGCIRLQLQTSNYSIKKKIKENLNDTLNSQNIQVENLYYLHCVFQWEQVDVTMVSGNHNQLFEGWIQNQTQKS